MNKPRLSHVARPRSPQERKLLAKKADLAGPNSPLTGPAARVVLAVLQQALLRPVGAERLIVGVKGSDGRFTVLRTDAYNLSEPGKPQFRWSQAAPIFGSLRLQPSGGAGSVVECCDRHLYRYSTDVGRSGQQVVVGAVLERAPEDITDLHAAVSSAIHTLLPGSDREIPDGCISVSVDPLEQGFSASVVFAGEGGLVRATGRAGTVAMATARATVEASGAPLRLRFADQIGVGGTPVALIVADSALGAVIGASELSAPGTVAPALAVLKAANSTGRIEAESTRASTPRIEVLL